MKVNKRTINYALAVLDNQLFNCKEHPKDKEQRAYYDGMLEMLEIICTKGFENLSFGLSIKKDHHYVPALSIMEDNE